MKIDSGGGSVQTGDIVEAQGGVTITKSYAQAIDLHKALEAKDEAGLGKQMFAFFEKYGPSLNACTTLAQMLIGKL